MKAVIFKQVYKNYKIGDIFFIDENSSVDSWLASNWLYAEGYVIGDVVPESIPSEFRNAEYLTATHFPYRAENWTKDGQTVYVDPQDETWTFTPEQAEFWQIGYKPGFNTPAIGLKYNEMVAEVYAQMVATFGTQDPDSASAYKETWDMMKEQPSAWTAAGLTARFDRGGLSAGDALDTEQKITDYANACISAAIQYGIWRMQRIEQFRQERNAILAGN